MKAIARKCQSNVFIMSFWGNCYFLNGKIVLCKANNRLKFQFDNLNIVRDSILNLMNLTVDKTIRSEYSKKSKEGGKSGHSEKKHQNQQLHSYRKCQLKLHFLKRFCSLTAKSSLDWLGFQATNQQKTNKKTRLRRVCTRNRA